MKRAMVLVLMLAAASPAAAQVDLLKRGDYLVNRVALCGECHSPRGDHGRFVVGQELTGSPFRGAPLHPIPNWAAYAPSIRGLPSGYTQESLAQLLETGHRADGSRPGPPMPPFQLEPEDARAVAVYLASLKP